MAAVFFNTAAFGYGPEEIVDPDMVGIKVYQGYIINHSEDKYLQVEIYNKEDTSTPLYRLQIAPQRPLNMPHKKWGEGYLPDLKAYKDLLEKYHTDYGGPLWIKPIVLREGTYVIRHKWSHLPETEWVVNEFVLSSLVADVAGGPYLLEFYE